MGPVNDEREQTLNQLLVGMDGFEANAGVIVLAATNRPETLDRALLRPGRFDRQVVVDAPDFEGRFAILRLHARNKPMAEGTDLRSIAAQTPGFSGADLANVMNEAALLAARGSEAEITQLDLQEAVEKVVAGPERKSRRLSDSEKRRVAYHEVGHALLAAYTEHADPVHKISIIPHGRAALGYTLQLPTEDHYLLDRSARKESFSYLDTQLSRLGSPNFHELPINRPKCPFANLQRDGHMQMAVPQGRSNYEPNTIDTNGPRESMAGFRTAPIPTTDTKVRLRPESFRDHYSQARMFYRSVTPQEQMHIQDALTFELSKVDIVEIRQRILGHLNVIDETLGAAVAENLGMTGEATAPTPAADPIDLDPSPALRLYGKYKPTLKGRKVGILIADGFNAKTHRALVAAVKKEGATPAIIAPKVGGAVDASGTKQAAEMALSGSPSFLFDAVAVLAGPDGDKSLSSNPDALSFLRDAKRHLKAIALSGVDGLAEKTEVAELVGVTNIDSASGIVSFIDFAKNGKVWERGEKPKPANNRKK